MMKKLLALTFILLILTACSQKNQLIGSWQTSDKMQGTAQQWTFEDDGTYIYKTIDSTSGNFEIFNGNYKIEGKSMTFTPTAGLDMLGKPIAKDQLTPRIYEFTLENGVLTLSINGRNYVCTRLKK
jgi:ABC-type glycerol-3-phosphate transport system substrate-binding protein